MPVPRQSLQALGSSLRILYVGAPLRALPHLDGRCAGAFPQEVTDVILVDLYEADLDRGAAHAISVVEGDCILKIILLNTLNTTVSRMWGCRCCVACEISGLALFSQQGVLC